MNRFARSLCAGTIGVAWCVAVHAAPTLSVALTPSSVTVGSPLLATVSVNDAVDLYAFEFDFNFNGVLLSALSVTEGAFLAGSGPTVFFPGAIDNSAGTVSFNGGSLLGPISGVTGTGVLMSILFDSLAAGVAQFSLSNVLLLDSSLTPSSATVTGATATITAAGPGGSAPVPLPGTLYLVLIGMALLVRPSLRV